MIFGSGGAAVERTIVIVAAVRSGGGGGAGGGVRLKTKRSTKATHQSTDLPTNRRTICFSYTYIRHTLTLLPAAAAARLFPRRATQLL